jgi:hypothetical protein
MATRLSAHLMSASQYCGKNGGKCSSNLQDNATEEIKSRIEGSIAPNLS